jgi:SpoVK/Ycf46/Vps4 family AAA+-type ATPase
MSANDAIRQIFIAHAKGDAGAFRVAAQAYIEQERGKSHHLMANELEKALNGSNGADATVRDLTLAINNHPTDLPRDKERGLSLVELRDPQWSAADLVLSAPTRKLLDRIVEENRRSQLIRSVGLWPVRKVLFWGPPGCGKTVAAEAIARELYLPLAVVRFDAVISSYLGETSANLRKVFDFARQRAMVVLFDEFDAIGKMREDQDEHGELKRVVNAFLQMMDGFRAEGVMIAATNHERLLDSALWRRFEEVVHFSRPDRQQIMALLTRNLRQMHVSPAVSLRSVSMQMLGMAHADIERVVVNSIKTTLIAGEDKISADTLQYEIAKQRDRDLAARGQQMRKPIGKKKKGLSQKRNASPSRR